MPAATIITVNFSCTYHLPQQRESGNREKLLCGSVGRGTLRTPVPKPGLLTKLRVSLAYWTAIVTVFEVTPPKEITTGTTLLGVSPAGTCAFTWYKPT